MTHVLAAVGARLSSSRLPGKHLLDLAGVPLIERIFQRLEAVPSVTNAVLATTDEADNTPLVDRVVQLGREVFAWDGPTADLMGRIDALVQTHQPDLFLYICGDCPLIDPDLIEDLIQAALKHPEADWITVPPRNGISVVDEGIDLYPLRVWNQVVAASKEAFHREHVGSARGLLSLKQHGIEREQLFYRDHVRLSVDTPSDYRFMRTVYQRWFSRHPADALVPLRGVLEMLDADPTLGRINRGVRQKGVRDRSRPVLLLTAANTTHGLGHLRRMMPLAAAMQDGYAAGVHLAIVGDPPALKDLALIPQTRGDDVATLVRQVRESHAFEILVCDLPSGVLDEGAVRDLARLQAEGVALISIDHSLPDLLQPSLNWVPSFYLKKEPAEVDRYGWDCYLLEADPLFDPKKPPPNRRVLVLTGGSDALGLGAYLPAALAKTLPRDVAVQWVHGPYADAPLIPEGDERFSVVTAPPDMTALYRNASHALCVYGVSFYECLRYGLATVVMAPDTIIDEGELHALIAAQTAVPAREASHAAQQLADLLSDPKESARLRQQSMSFIDGQGAARLAEALLGEA